MYGEDLTRAQIESTITRERVKLARQERAANDTKALIQLLEDQLIAKKPKK